jgi:hypothetical protein
MLIYNNNSVKNKVVYLGREMIKRNIIKKIVLSIFLMNTAGLFASAVIPYSKENKLHKEFHASQSYKSEYDSGGSNYSKKYNGLQEKNEVAFSKEGVADGDVISCLAGNGNLSTRVGNKRKFHEVYGMVGEEGTVLTENGTTKGDKTPYDMTSIKNFDEIQGGYNSAYRGNSSLERFCNSPQLKNGGDGEYDVDKIYCEAGMETTSFIGFTEDPYTLEVPTCKLTLDTDIKIDEVRYLRQVISPDNNSGDIDDNYSMGNGLVKCSVKNGSLYLEMLDNPVLTDSCNPSNFATYDGGKGCCNPTTGFGCNAQFCQYGSDKHCKGKNIAPVGSCTFKSEALIFVKGIITLSSENGGSGTFKCLESGDWLVQSTTGC